MNVRIGIGIGAITLLLGSGIAFAAASCDDLFNKLDTNKNNELSYEEFSKLENLDKLPFTDKKVIEKNKDSATAAEECKRAWFETTDKNKDKKISKKEFEEFFNATMDPYNSTHQ